MSAKFTRPGRIASLRELERHRRQLAALKSELRGEIPGASRREMARYQQHLREDVREDRGRLEAQAKRLERIISSSEPGNVSVRERNAIMKRAKELSEMLRKKMVPKTHYNVKPNHPEYQKVVKQMGNEMTPEFQERAQEYKNIQRQLNPDDPAAGNLERIRPGRS